MTTRYSEQTAKLAELIEAHRAAWEAFNVALERQADAETDAFPGNKYSRVEEAMPHSIGGCISIFFSAELDTDEQDAVKRLKQLYDLEYRKIDSLPIDDEHKEAPRQSLEEKYQRDLTAMNEAYAKERQRQSEIGFAAFMAEYERANEEEMLATFNLLAFPCTTLEQIKMRAEYILADENGPGSSVFHSLYGGGNMDLLTAFISAGTVETEEAA